MTPRVSVIVPVYNPGSDIDDCIRSLLGQSLPAEQVELIFVDDGSTDATPARLDALAAEHERVRVEHIPNSGWPGRPRNVGLGMARGEYVYFVDNDDWLAPDALERMLAMAAADDADIVIGKVVGHRKRVSRSLFRENVHAIPFDSPFLLALLTPHKLFRRSLIEEHGIRFPEGRRRLEDHVFVLGTYFKADRISVLADYPCYHWVLRDPETNASFADLEPIGYYRNVAEVLDLVEAHTEPGPFRDRLLVHWYRNKMLFRVGGVRFRRRGDDVNRPLFEAVRELALARFGEDVHERLGFNMRLRSKLLRGGEYDGLRALAESEGALRARARAGRVRGDGASLTIDIAATLAAKDHPLVFERRGDRILYRAPEAVRALVDESDLDATEAIDGSTVQVYLYSVDDESEYLLDTETEVQLQEDGDGLRPRLRARVRVAPTIAAAGAPLPAGDWEVRAVVTVAGFSDARTVKTRGGAPLVLTSIPPARVVHKRDAVLRPALGRRIAVRMPRLARLVRRVRAGAGAADRG